MALRDALRKAAGLLVELPPETAPPQGKATAAEVSELLAELESGSKPVQSKPGPTKTVDQIVREAEGPNLDEIGSLTTSSAPAVGADGKVDFGPVYAQSDLPVAPFTAEQMLDMLSSLPPELPLDTKRQTVRVTLEAMGRSLGATPETIVADASRKLAALTAYAEQLSTETASFVAATEQEVSALQAQIEEKRQAALAAQRKQEEAQQLCDAESERLDDVLEFFSLDVPPSKYAAPEQKAS
jgi:gas vesicle protein